jgi:hypothetical protein
LGAALCSLLGLYLSSSGDYDAAWLVIALGAIAGAGVGRRVFSYACSDPRCEATLSLGDDCCAACGGIVRGTIRSRAERLAAEEDLENRTV